MTENEAVQAFIYAALTANPNLAGIPVHIEFVPQEGDVAATPKIDSLPAILVQVIQSTDVKFGMIKIGATEIDLLAFGRSEGLNYPFALQGAIQASLHDAGANEPSSGPAEFSVKSFRVMTHQRAFEDEGRQMRDAGGRYKAIVRPV